MEQANSNALVINVATHAVFGLQLNTRQAAHYVRDQIPTVSLVEAAKVIDAVARPEKKAKSK